jgi:hypothetical protein
MCHCSNLVYAGQGEPNSDLTHDAPKTGLTERAPGARRKRRVRDAR